ncbi:MAG TPA: ABC transporter permease, partial [Terriglobales bacterium]|nr:ABC transporter permease [Terriglobales bacterium]
MIRDLLQESYDAMRHNRRRTALTMLGMAWGIATVVMLLAYGDGFGRACTNIFANFGTKLLIVIPGRSSMQSGGEKAGAQIRLTLDDVDLLSTNIPQITHITPDCFKTATVQYDTRSYTMNVNGEYPNTFAIRALTLAQGVASGEKFFFGFGTDDGDTCALDLILGFVEASLLKAQS